MKTICKILNLIHSLHLGRCLLPFASILHFVQETLAADNETDISTQNIEFENVQFLRARFLKPNTNLNLRISIKSLSGEFDVSEGESIIVRGSIKSTKNPNPIIDGQSLYSESIAQSVTLSSAECYKELRLRGFDFTGHFRSIFSMQTDFRRCQIKWNGNWATFLDAMVQLFAFAKDTRRVAIPLSIQRIRINAGAHLKWINEFGKRINNEMICDAYLLKDLSTIVCGGVEIISPRAVAVEKRKQDGIEVLETYQFVPLFESCTNYDLNDAAGICIQLAIEKLQTDSVKLVEILSNRCDPTIDYFFDAFKKTPSICADLTLLSGSNKVSLKHPIPCENSTLEMHPDCTFIVMNKCMDQKKNLLMALQNLSKDGFLIAIEDIKKNCKYISVPDGFKLVSVVPSIGVTFAVMQRTHTEHKTNETAVIPIDSTDVNFEWLHTLRRSTIELDNAILVAQNDSCSGLLGLINCLRRETFGQNFRCIIVDDEQAPPFAVEHPFYQSQLALELPINIYQNGKWGTYRHLTLKQTLKPQKSAEVLDVNIKNIGDLQSLCWSPAIDCRDSIEVVKVVYASINYRDVLLALGNIPLETVVKNRLSENRSVLGIDFAGVTSNGNRVMGIKTEGGTLSTHIACKKVDTILFDVPDSMTLMEAATIPAAYLTVYDALFVDNTIQSDQSILIHLGSGGVGLAAIEVALAYGLNIFTTVSTKEKKDFILKRYPEIKGINFCGFHFFKLLIPLLVLIENQIGNSRDCSFEQIIMEKTNGKGVNIVLNSLSGDKLQASIRCLQRYGKFFDMTKSDMLDDSNLGMRVFEKGIVFRPISIDKILENPRTLKQAIERMKQDLERGVIQPLPSITFDADDVQHAFRLMASAKHVGKILLQIRDSEHSDYSLPITITSKLVCNPKLVS